MSILAFAGIYREQVSELPSIDVVRIKDGVASTLRLNSFEDSEVSARANGFRDMILSFAHKVSSLGPC